MEKRQHAGVRYHYTRIIHPSSHPISSFSKKKKKDPDLLQLGRRRLLTRARNLIVQQRSQELSVLLAGNLRLKVLGRKLVLVALAGLLLQLVGLLVQQLQRVAAVELLAALGRDAMAAPLPQLGPADFRRRRVLHQVVDGHAPDAAQPALHIPEADVEVLADAVL